ncbi:unnamed protein product [Eruca vesicaria subsp. sativa]|uniref:Uncharacterized protein n=1 Tax=Eruca vesicaria subsp. sativa TaxID=29727 RepID=A0ABC8J7P9_ERUVS|nr:unnamed protein product [Eruca vesicaria subsp. sativa]
MEIELPKRIAEAGVETCIEKINNTCRLTILQIVKEALKDEYDVVLKDPVFIQFWLSMSISLDTRVRLFTALYANYSTFPRIMSYGFSLL